MIAVDNTFLTLMLHPSARPPLDPSTGLRVTHVEERIELLIETLEEDREIIIIPTPVLSEFLILAGNDGPRYLTKIDNSRYFKIEAFDTKAAVELAAIELGIKKSKADKRGGAGGTWAKIKFDRQIVTIAKVNGASKIYSDDDDVERFARRCGIAVVKTWELPLREHEQGNFLTALEEATSAHAPLLTGNTVEGDNNYEEATAGTKEATESTTGISAIQRFDTAFGVSAEGGSGQGEGEGTED